LTITGTIGRSRVIPACPTGVIAPWSGVSFMENAGPEPASGASVSEGGVSPSSKRWAVHGPYSIGRVAPSVAQIPNAAGC